MPATYSTAEKVIKYTGVKPDDFALEDEQALQELITGWLVEIKDLIDQDRNRDYTQEVEDGKRDKVPPGIEGIALRMAANMVAQATLRRETPIVRVDDFSIQMVQDQVFTDAIKNDLARFPFKPNFGIMRVNNEG